MPVRFGATLIQVVPYPQLRADCVFVESLGLDNAWLIDQFGIDGFPDVPLLEAWTTLGALARDTTRIRLGTMVTNVAMRHPGVLAQSILTVDHISAGRVEAALGGGFYSTEHEALGIDFLDASGRHERLRDAVAVLDRALRGETVSHDGPRYRLHEATFRPLPTQLPRPPLWVAAQGPRSMRVAVQHAEALITLGAEEQGMDVSLPAFRERVQRLEDLCVEAGRDPATIRRCLFAGWANEPIFASVDATAEFVGRYVEAGATDFTFYLQNPAEPLFDELVAQHRMATRDQLQRAAEEVFAGYRAIEPDTIAHGGRR
jgi:alkanesulfonate monooxygenase SsuD/methylene tetrahydromethanopterin reductase-like flavin-dependent oxidoreductase (luciferase family)